MNNFTTEMFKLDPRQRCLQTEPGRWDLPLGDVILGVPQSEFFGWTQLEALPEDTRGIKFYLGSDCCDLIQAFVESPLPGQIERLTIGTSSYSGGRQMDYEKITEILAGVEFPSLNSLELGIWQLFHNAHGCCGKIGQITKLLKQAPRLQELALHGTFELSESLIFPELATLSIEVEGDLDYLEVNRGIGQDTLDNLLLSSFPALKEAALELYCEEGDKNYSFPDSFLSGKSTPELKQMYYTGKFRHGEHEKILNSDLCRKHGAMVSYEDLEEW